MITVPWPVLIWIVAGPWLLGWGLLRLAGLRRDDDPLGHVAWAWMAGALATGLLAFGSLALSLPHGALPFTVGGAAALALALSLRRARPPRPAPAAPASRLFRTGMAAILVLVVVHVLAAGASPVNASDEGDIWSMRAKIMHVAGDFGPSWRALTAPERSDVDLAHDYPELNPLLQHWVFANVGGIVHFENRLPIQLFAVALVLVLGATLRRILRPLPALLGVAALVATPYFWDLSLLAYADLMVAAGAALALQGHLLGVRAAEEGRSWGGFAFLGALGLAVCVWSKNEGLLVFAAVLAALGLRALLARRAGRSGWRREAAWLVLPAFFAVLARGFNAVHGFRNTMLSPDDAAASPLARLVETWPVRIGPFAAWFRDEMLLRPRLDAGIFTAFVAALLLVPDRLVRGSRTVPALAVLRVLAGVTAVYFTGTRTFTWYLETSCRRVYAQMLPVLLVLLAQLLAEARPRLAARDVDASARGADQTFIDRAF